MEKIYSKVNPGVLCHLIHRVADFSDGRMDLIDPDNFIQCSVLKLKKGTTFKPHHHIFTPVTYDERIANESWVVIKGSVKCTLYDLDNTVLCEPVLNQGDASFTLLGGHTYTILKDNSQIMEFKTGPYLGQETDKVFI
jgi:hypothetical protein